MMREFNIKEDENNIFKKNENKNDNNNNNNNNNRQ
jgi:hypothetical protein